MQVTTGVDIIEVARIKEAVNKIGDDFLNRIYTDKEIEYCSQSKQMKYQHFAARFAAKEATFKAISSYIHGREDTLWKKIEVINSPEGKPAINVKKLKKDCLQNLKSIDISISHIKDYAIASVVAIFEEDEKEK